MAKKPCEHSYVKVNGLCVKCGFNTFGLPNRELMLKAKNVKRFKVEFIQTETFVVDVLATTEKQAIKLAEKKWEEGNYQENGDCEVKTGTIYDVTHTEDPFNP